MAQDTHKHDVCVLVQDPAHAHICYLGDLLGLVQEHVAGLAVKPGNLQGVQAGEAARQPQRDLAAIPAAQQNMAHCNSTAQQIRLIWLARLASPFLRFLSVEEE